MTSHSPMTVAALDETDIFRVVRTGGHVDISRTTKSEAINELSKVSPPWTRASESPRTTIRG